MSIQLNLQIACTLPVPSSAQFERWVKTILTLINLPTTKILTIRVVEEDEIQLLNSQYRHKDKPTNVLSFPFELPLGLPSEAAEEMSDELGDIVICPKVVLEEAAEQGKSSVDHWAHMVVHGTLHLLGYDHISDDDAARMEELEVKALKQLNIPDPYQTYKQTH